MHTPHPLSHHAKTQRHTNAPAALHRVCVLARHRVPQEAKRAVPEPPQHVAHVVVPPQAQARVAAVGHLQLEKVRVLFWGSLFGLVVWLWWLVRGSETEGKKEAGRGGPDPIKQ